MIQKPSGGDWEYIDEDPDRESTNDDDGQHFYGFDDEDSGETTWYNEDGGLEDITPTPSDDY